MGITERKQRDRDRRIHQILIAAKRCFKKYGYGETSIAAIAEAAELSTGTIYLYFQNKEDMYAAVLSQIIDRLNLRFVHVASQNIERLEERLNAVMGVLIETFADEPQFTMALFHLLSQIQNYDLSERTHENLAAAFNTVKQATIKLFDSDRKGKDRQRVSPTVLADIFWSTFIGVALNETGKRQLFDSEIDVKSKIEIIFDIFKQGILHQNPIG